MLRKVMPFIILLILIGCNSVNNYRPEQMNFDSVYLPNLSGHIISSETVDNMVITDYEKAEPYVYQYGGLISINGIDYYLGESFSNDFQFSLSPFTYDSQPVYYWVKDYGAAAASTCTHFVALRNKMPNELICIDGVVDFRDLDGNGVPEVISSNSSGIPADVHIYFWNGNTGGFELTIFNVNEALNAFSVYYKDGIFIAYNTEKDYTTNNVPREYIYKEGVFVESNK